MAVCAGQRPRAGTQLESRGRILGRIANCPGCTIDVLDGERDVVKSLAADPGQDGYQAEWLDAGTYTLRVTAKGYKTLHTVALLVKDRHDLQCNLRFVDEPPESEPSSDEARRKVKTLPTWSPKPAPKAPVRNFKPKGFGALDKKFKNADPRNKRKVKAQGKGKQKRKGQQKGKKKTGGKKKAGGKKKKAKG